MTDKPTRSLPGADKTVSLPVSLVLSLATLFVGAGAGGKLESMAGSGSVVENIEKVSDQLDIVAGEIRRQGTKLEAQNVRLAGVERSVERIEERGSDRWTRTNMRLWVSELGRKNQSLDLPDIGAQ